MARANAIKLETPSYATATRVYCLEGDLLPLKAVQAEET